MRGKIEKLIHYFNIFMFVFYVPIFLNDTYIYFTNGLGATGVDVLFDLFILFFNALGIFAYMYIEKVLSKKTHTFHFYIACTGCVRIETNIPLNAEKELVKEFFFVVMENLKKDLKVEFKDIHVISERDFKRLIKHSKFISSDEINIKF